MDPAAANGAAHANVPSEPLILTRQQVEERERFPLIHTGGEARVRKIPLISLVASTNLSPTMYPTRDGDLPAGQSGARR
jgi:hypothetical protein